MNQLKLTVTDYKSFEGESISIRNLTVLAGINSAGKSSVIQALLILRLTVEQHRLYGHNGPISIPLNGSYNMELGNTLEVIRRSKRFTDSTMRLELEDQKNRDRLDAIYSGDRTDQANYELLTGGYTLHGSNTDLLHPYFYYLCAERIGPRLKYEHSVLAYKHVGYKGEHTLQILSGDNIEIPIEKILEKKSEGLLLGATRDWLEHIIPGSKFGVATSVGRSRVIEGTFAESLPTNVGFGISYVLPIIVNCLIAEKNSMLIVENPEAHLHPMGQSRIGYFLAQIAASGVRVVIETHSEHVINGIRLASLIGLTKSDDIVVNFIAKSEEGQIKIDEINLTEAADLTSYPKGFFDQEQDDIAAMITEKRKRQNDESKSDNT